VLIVTFSVRARATRGGAARDDDGVSNHENVARPEPLGPGLEPDVTRSCVAWLTECLALDAQLAEAFERTPGKVAHLVGIPYDLIPAVLVEYWKRWAAQWE
jgi:hypothetical protein